MPEWYNGNMIVVCSQLGAIPVVRTFKFADEAWSYAKQMTSAGCDTSVIIGMEYKYAVSVSK